MDRDRGGGGGWGGGGLVRTMGREGGGGRGETQRDRGFERVLVIH